MKVRIPLSPKPKNKDVRNLEDVWEVLSIEDLDIIKRKAKNAWDSIRGKYVYFLAAVAVVSIFSVVGAVFFHYQVGVDLPWLEVKNHETAAYWGQLGDFVGGILNPLLSFVAFIAVLINLVLQRHDLSLAREEAREANKNQRLQSKIFEKQNEAVERQNFESTFFRLMETHNQQSQLACVTMLPTAKVKVGDECFSWVKYKFLPESTYGIEVVELLRQNINLFSSQYSLGMSRYFRNLHQLLKFIDDYGNTSGLRESALPGMRIRKAIKNYGAQRVYANILRAQLSNDELCCIFVNCLSVKGEGLKYYVEKYSLLKGVELPEPYRFSQVKSLYDDIAYSDSEDITKEQLFEIAWKKYGSKDLQSERIKLGVGELRD